jgi:hypothetical protein
MTDENAPAGENTGAGGQRPPAAEGVPLAAEIVQLQAKYQRLTAANTQEMAALAQMGAGIDPSGFNRLRLDMFISFIFARLGNTSAEVRELLTLQFEVTYEDTVLRQLKAAKGEVRKATMGLGAQVSKEQIEEMWRRQQGGNGGPGGLIRP